MRDEQKGTAALSGGVEKPKGKGMKKIAILVAAMLVLAASQAFGQQKAPMELAGLTLGKPIKDYVERLDTDKAVPIWDKPYLVRMNVKPTKGFKAGYVLFGQCVNEGRIVRLKFKYKDGSEAFFKDTLAKLTKRFGKPKSLSAGEGGGYQGYRWTFGPDKDKAVTVLFERYSGSGIDVTEGNSIRMTDNALLAEERACYDAKRDREPEAQPAFPLFTIDDEWLLPH